MTNDERLRALIEASEKQGAEPWIASSIDRGGTEPEAGYSECIVTHGERSFVVGIASYSCGRTAYDRSRYVAAACTEAPFAAHLVLRRGEAIAKMIDKLQQQCKMCGTTKETCVINPCSWGGLLRDCIAALEEGTGDA